jgi:hypothetical protein
MRKMKIILTVAVLFSLALSATAFSAPITIAASATPKTGGTITPSGRLKIFPGADQTFEIRPVIGYEIKDVVIDRVSHGKINKHTFTNVTSNHSIQVKFGAVPFTTTIRGQQGVKITPFGAKIYKYGKKQAFTVTPPKGVTDVPIVMVDGKKLENYDPTTNPYGLKKVGANYKFTLVVTGNHSVVASTPITAVIPETTQHVNETTIQSISETGRVTFFQPTTLKVGDIIVGDATASTPKGLLRKVTSVSIDKTYVETTPVSLEEAIEKGQVQVSKVLSSADVGSITALKGVSFQKNVVQPQALEGFYFELRNVILYDDDGDPITEDDQIKANGGISLDPSFNFYMEIDNFQLSNIIFSNTVTETIEIAFLSGFSLAEIREKIEVARLEFTPITCMVGLVPVVIVPVLTINVGIDGEVSVGITSSVTQEAQLTAGLSYNSGIWTPISQLSNDFNFVFPSFSATAKAKVYAGPQLNLLIYGLAGPYFEVKGYLDFEVDPFSAVDPWWELYAGLEADIGVRVEILDKQIVDYELPGVIGYRKLLADSDTVHHQVDYSGNWRGAWNGWDESGGLTVTMFQPEYGTTLTGTMTPSNSDMPANQAFLGEVDGNRIKWVTANFGRCTMTATGEAVSPTHLSGSYEVICAGELWDIGTWYLDKQP